MSPAILEIGMGLALISPADEAALALATAGVGLAAAPAQGPASAVLGSVLVLDGLRRLWRDRSRR